MKTRISVFFGALISFTAVSSVARADWYMVGPREFKPENSTLVYGPLADGIKLSGGVADYLVAPIRLPAGSAMTSVFCQLYDAASAFDINVNFQEIQTDDNAGVISRSIFSFNSSGSTGHRKYADTTASGSAIIKTFDNAAAGGANRYYSYVLRVRLNGSSTTALKSCAIGYTP